MLKVLNSILTSPLLFEVIVILTDDLMPGGGIAALIQDFLL